MKLYRIAALIMTLLSVAHAGDVKHAFVATDESGKQLIYVDETNPANDWTIALKGNRDIQLTKNGSVLVSVPTGYREYSLKGGKLVKDVTVGKGIQSVVRLDDGRTILASKREVLVLDEKDAVTVTHKTKMSGFFRLLRVAKNGNYLYTSGKTTIAEVKPTGEKVRELDLTKLTPDTNKPYFMEELPDGKFVISTGYGATILIVDNEWKLIKAYGGKGKIAGVQTHFFADVAVLKNGNMVFAHWSGHARKDSEKAPQAIEFDTDGKVVWTWHDPKRAGTLHGIEIVK